MERTTVAFLGTGAMGEALLKGSLGGGLDPRDVWVTGRRQARLDELVDAYDVHGTTDNAAAAGSAQLIVVAVAPVDVLPLLGDVGDHLRDDAVVVSLADAVSLDDLAEHLPERVGAARAMPSLTAQVGQGLTLLTAGSGCTDTQVETVTTFLARSGEVLRVEEDQHAALGPLSSGGPAYFLYVADAMIEAGALRGVSRSLARGLVARAMAGSAAWLESSSDDTGALRAAVCAPGGAGIRRIAELDERAVRAAFVAALTRPL